MGRDWLKTGKYQDKSTDREADLQQLAGTQKSLVTIDQARAVGIPAATMHSRAAAGRIHRLYAGVYSLAPPPFTRKQLWLGAVLACQPDSLLSDLPAASVLGLTKAVPAAAHVTVTSNRGRGREGIIVHRRTIERVDAFRRDGIPCTSPARTLLDLAPSLSLDALEGMLIIADSFGIVNRRRLEELVGERYGQPGTGKLNSLLGIGPVRVRSPAEAKFLILCRRAGIAEPAVNSRVKVAGGSLEVDFCWPDLRIIVEIDGYAFHGGRSRANADRDRDQLLAIAGWSIHRFTADQVRNYPGETIRRLKLIMAAIG